MFNHIQVRMLSSLRAFWNFDMVCSLLNIYFSSSEYKCQYMSLVGLLYGVFPIRSIDNFPETLQLEGPASSISTLSYFTGLFFSFYR